MYMAPTAVPCSIWHDLLQYLAVLFIAALCYAKVYSATTAVQHDIEMCSAGTTAGSAAVWGEVEAVCSGVPPAYLVQHMYLNYQI